MINTLYGVLLIVALAIMPLRGMETEFARAADEAGEAMIKAKEAIDEYIATLPLEQQEEFERQVAKYKDFSKLTIEEQLEYERLAAELFGRSYEVVILEQIVEQAKNILWSFELRENAKKALVILMNDEKLDAHIKKAIQEDIEIIQKVVGKGLFREAHNAYRHLQCVVADSTAQLTGIETRSRMERAVDYVSRKIYEGKRAISNMWYGKKRDR